MTRLLRLVYVLFVVCMSIFIILSISYLKRQKELDENIRYFERSNAVLLAIEQINGILNANGSLLRTMLIMGNKKTLPDVMVGNIVLLQKADSLVSLTSHDPEQQKRAIELKRVLDKRYELIRNALPVYSSNQQEVTKLIEELSQIRGEYDKVYVLFAETEKRSVSQIRKNRDASDRFSYPVLMTLLIFSTVFLLGTFLYLVLTLKKRIFFQGELQAKLRILNQANRELENLSRVTSHHIQEPMRKIRNFSTLLDKRLDQMDESEVRQIIGKIEGNAGSLQVLAQNLVQYANLIQDARIKEKVNLNEVISEVEYKMEDLIFETKTEIKRSDLPVIDAIPHQLFILFQELITNSIAFTKPDHTPLVEMFEVRSDDPEFVTIAVKDHGVGFSNEFAERIFRIFEQLEPRSAPGKGIGLAMCSRIMLNHGGKIRAEGKAGEGATFFLDFPAPQLVKPRSRHR